MKKKQLLISLSLAITVLFSILFQSFHAYAHFIKQYSQTECHHNYNANQREITHQHHNFEHCYVCDFTFGSYVSPDIFSCQLVLNHKEIPYFFETAETVILFSGSLYSLRGPPSVIV